MKQKMVRFFIFFLMLFPLSTLADMEDLKNSETSKESKRKLRIKAYLKSYQTSPTFAVKLGTEQLRLKHYGSALFYFEYALRNLNGTLSKEERALKKRAAKSRSQAQHLANTALLDKTAEALLSLKKDSSFSKNLIQHRDEIMLSYTEQFNQIQASNFKALEEFMKTKEALPLIEKNLGDIEKAFQDYNFLNCKNSLKETP